MRWRLSAIASLLLLVFLGAVALGSSGYFARLFVDGVEVASQQLDPGTRDVRVVVDGPAGTLLDESFQVDVPDTTTTTQPPQQIVIDSDTLIENETLTLRAGDSIEFRNGARLMFGEGASADWQGTPTSTWSDDGAVQNLDRDVDIFGSGDIMFMAGSEPSVIRFVEIDLQPLEEVDHYPLHWHKVGDGSRGTLVEGVVVKNSTNRAFVPHASHGITFRDTIAKNVAGEPYWWNPPPSQSPDTVNNSNDILYDHALADGVTNRVGDDRGIRLRAFDLGAGTGNTVRDSVALNVNPSHPKNCAGFGWPELNVNQPSVWTFQNNKTFGSDCNGIFVWQNDIDVHLVDDFTSTEPIEHGAYNNRYLYRNADVPGVLVHATGWGMEGGSIGDVTALRHRTEGTVTFENLTVDSLTIRNAVDGGSVPADYVFDNTTLDCSAVTWANVVAGTTVTIDGEPCTEGDTVAFPSIRSSSTATTATTSGHAPTMPASISSGDLLVAVAQINSGNATFSSSPNWTTKETVGIGTDPFLYVFVRVATGDANDNISFNTSALRGVAWTILAIQDWEGTLSGVESASAARSVDPPSLTPSWGSADTLWLVGAGAGGGTLPAVSAWSTSFTEEGQITADFGTDALSGVAYRQNAVTTENPSSITISGSPTQSHVVTIAVEPAAGGPVTGSLAETEADDTLSASGTHTPPAFTGTLAETEADDTLAASGTHTPPSFTGSLAETEADDTLAASGNAAAPSFTGTLAETEEADTLAASGTFTPLAITGSLAETEEDDTLSAVGGDGRVIRFREVALNASAKTATIGASRKEATLS